MAIQPQRKANYLIEQMNAAREGDKITDEVLAHFEQEGQNLRATDIADGDLVLGIVAAHKGDLKEARKRLKNAQAFHMDPEVVEIDLGIAHFLCGDYSGAIQILAPHMGKVKDAALIVGRSCELLGLHAKAKNIFDSLDLPDKDSFSLVDEKYLYRSNFLAPALDKLENSFKEDAEIWQSLSRR